MFRIEKAIKSVRDLILEFEIPRISCRDATEYYSGMSRRSGRRERLSLYDRGNDVCPICLTDFARRQVYSGRTVTLEHVPIKALGGKPRCITCENCNAQAGRGIDQEAANRARMQSRDWSEYGITALGKRRKFRLSHDGKQLTHPFAGLSDQDLQVLQTRSTEFTIEIRFTNEKFAAISSLKSAYVAMFSLLGSTGGYLYVQGDALTPVRQQILEPLHYEDMNDYVTKMPDGVPLNDIMLVNEPLSCWMVKVADHLVFLPLSGDSLTSQPLKELKHSYGEQFAMIKGIASWSFSKFGEFRTVSVHLPGADTAQSLVGLLISGTLPNGRSLDGTCVSHSGEAATILCPVSAIIRAGIGRKNPRQRES